MDLDFLALPGMALLTGVAVFVVAWVRSAIYDRSHPKRSGGR